MVICLKLKPVPPVVANQKGLCPRAVLRKHAFCNIRMQEDRDLTGCDRVAAQGLCQIAMREGPHFSESQTKILIMQQFGRGGNAERFVQLRCEGKVIRSEYLLDHWIE